MVLRERMLRLQQQQLTALKVDRVYDDRLSDAISDELWAEKSGELQEQLRRVRARMERHDGASQAYETAGLQTLDSREALIRRTFGKTRTNKRPMKQSYRTPRSVVKAFLRPPPSRSTSARMGAKVESGSTPVALSVAAMERRPRQLFPDGDFRLTCGVGLISRLEGTGDATGCIKATKAFLV